LQVIENLGYYTGITRDGNVIRIQDFDLKKLYKKGI
jgi:hypothetical protein